MKILVILVFITGMSGICTLCTVTAATEKVFVQSKLKADSTLSAILEMLREVIKQGYPEAGIPVLDPYQFDYTKIDYEDAIFRISANVTDGSFTGLGDFMMRKFDFTMGRAMYLIDFDVYFPSLNFTSKYYEMEASIIEAFPLAGKGVARVEIYDLNIWSKIYFQVYEDGSGIHVEKLDEPGFSVSRIVSKTEYDNNIDGIANAMVEELLAGYLNRFNKFLAATASPLIINALNKLLSENSYYVI